MQTVGAYEKIEFDVVVIGAGLAGLSAAIRIKQINPALSVVVLEKGASVGDHVLSGAVVDPVGIDALFPDWRKENSNPFKTVVAKDHFMFLTEKKAIIIPNLFLPRIMSNHGNFIVSLGTVCRWLAEKAEKLGVEIYPGFSGAKILYNANGAVTGVVTGEMGLRKDGGHGSNYVPGMALMGKYILIGEGARGSLAKELINRYALDKNRSPQKYGLGIKELWEIDPSRHQTGLVQHSFGWPLNNSTGGGSFLYHLENNRIAVGFVVHLDYKNPYLSPFEEFQRFKSHPAIRNIFTGGKRLSYGARCITEGGWQSVPKLVFPGGTLIGCAAGFVNVPRLKGSHNAILSGIMAAGYVVDSLSKGRANDEITEIEENWRKGNIGQDLFPVRNVKPACEKYGTGIGSLIGGVDMWCHQLFGRSLLGTLQHIKTDAASLEPANRYKPCYYPGPDSTLTFDRLSSVYLSNTHHEDDEPCHLQLKDQILQETLELCVYDGPSTRYCPAAVYEWIEEGNKKSYKINAQNCLHCKACDIKDPGQNINWTPPQGGGGPVYSGM